jgi:hypothetical protein
VVLVLGPRQCRKSTLVRAHRPGWLHLDLERPADVGLLQADLEGFFRQHPRGVAIDEAQALPGLFPGKSGARQGPDRDPALGGDRPG